MPATSHEKPSAVRIGAVSYLNTKPLIATLDQRLTAGSQLKLDLPSQLADQLSDGKLDIGLIPAVEFFRGPAQVRPTNPSFHDYRMISNACIACRGSVRSVRLFFRVPPNRVKTIAADVGSKTSVALSSILLHRRYGTLPRFVPLPIGSDPNSADNDAVLVIGDRAMHPNRFEGFLQNWDLGNEWYRETGLPFVFAMWVGRSSVATPSLASQLESARDEGVQNIDSLSEQYAASYDLSVAECKEYLSVHLRFTMNEAEMQGLKSFYQMASTLGIISAAPLPNWSLVSNVTSPQLVTT